MGMKVNRQAQGGSNNLQVELVLEDNYIPESIEARRNYAPGVRVGSALHT